MQNTTISNRSRHSFTIGDLEINGFGDMKRWDAQRD